MMTLSVVLPAYNEEAAIAGVIERVDRALDTLVRSGVGIAEAEIIVVDDGSTDATSDRARVSPRVRIFTHSRNRGYGAALTTGFLNARGSLIAFLDADGTYPPEHLDRLCQPLLAEQADMAIARRNGAGPNHMPRLRRLGNRVFAWILSWIAETRVFDTASGMRVFRKRDLRHLLPLPDGLDFIVGLSTRALHEGLRVVEVPVPYDERRGESKLRVVQDGFRFLATFLTVASTYNPLKFLGTLGLLALALAVYLGIAPVVYYLRFGRVEEGEIYRLFTILVLGIIGLQLINLGIIANRMLALVSGPSLERRSLIGRIVFHRGFSRVNWGIGIACCLGAVLLNYRTIVQYLTLRSIDVHWSYIITGATAFLVGAQLLMTGAVLAIFRLVGRRRVYRDRLTAADPSDRLASIGHDAGAADARRVG